LRIRVKDILDMLAGGAAREEILADYPYLEDLDITAALEYAGHVTDEVQSLKGMLRKPHSAVSIERMNEVIAKPRA